jgi:Bacterial Ig-like domain
MNSIRLAAFLVVVLTGCWTEPISPPAPVAPRVVSVSPANGATGVRSDAKIIVTFSQPMDRALTQAAYQSTDLPSANVTFGWDTSGTVMTIKPNAPLEYAKGTTIGTEAKSHSFTLTGEAKDTAGTPLAPLSSSFTTLREITLTIEQDGYVSGNWQSNGREVLSLENIFAVGDIQLNYGIRSFLSFNLPALTDSSANLVQATLSLYKVAVNGNPYQDLNPCISTPVAVCNLKGVPVSLDLVDYGTGVGFSEYNTPTLVAMVIDSSRIPENTRVQAAVLSAVRYDIDQRKKRSQYRLSFPKTTDADSQPDYVVYDYGHPNEPFLILKYLVP